MIAVLERIGVDAADDDDRVVIEVEDDGPGFRRRLSSGSSSLFATKPPGKGIGLGLDIIYNIVVNEHRGDIMFSKSGSQ